MGNELASEILERSIEKILSGIPGVHASLDDIDVTGKNDTEYFQKLDTVLQRLEKYGLQRRKLNFQIIS